MRLLLIEDDALLGARLKQRLQKAGYAVDWRTCGVDGLHEGHYEPYDVIVLDLGLPDISGMEVLARWRNAGVDTPVLILTARDGWSERVAGLHAGADDYLGKPFKTEELLARLQAILRRSAKVYALELRIGRLRLDEQRQCLVDEQQQAIALTATEFRLLRYFLRNPEVVLSKTQLSEHIYDDQDTRDSNILEVYIRRLRERIGVDAIQTHRGKGYSLNPRALE
ncbi:response regulator transcription factor [Thiorhodospira sibirica]|uniref:response regulator transcription factor n=1 Tax=Thiorhodospira sibirica TaxID=154347 RepID=UPI00022C0ACF|nr:response regulator transcription factor [Thiorhodospira sibirica]